MISDRDELIKWSKQNQQPPGCCHFDFVNQLLATPSPLVAISAPDAAASISVSADLVNHYLQQPGVTVVYYDAAANETTADAFLTAANSERDVIYVISGFDKLKGTKLWIKQLSGIAKRLHSRFFLFFEDVGLLYRPLFKRFEINHFYLPSMRFSEWLMQIKNYGQITSETYQLFLNTQITQHNVTNRSLMKDLVTKIEKIMRHDVYDLHQKKYSVHSCLQLLRYVAYAATPLFDLFGLATSLELDYLDLLAILKTLGAAQIIKQLPLVSKELRRLSPSQVYIVFCDPVLYGAFKGYEFNGTQLNHDLKLWVSTLINSYHPLSELVIVQDLYVPLNEQIALFEQTSNTFLQMGHNHSAIGPLLVHFQNANVKRCHYFGLHQLVNFIVNWQLKTLTRYKI